MRIQRIRITNFRQYQSLDLDLSDDRSDMVVFVGKNGTGKTNLLNALTWCLYGHEEYYGKHMEETPLVNQSSLLAADDGGLVTCEVTADLCFANHVEARVTRRAEFTRAGRAAKPNGKPQLTVAVLEDVSKGMRAVGNPETWIERWVPSKLEPYFLFDGERLDGFFKDVESKKIEDAVLQIAQIDLLGRLVDHLDKVASELYSKAAKESGGTELDLLRQQLDAAREGLAASDAALKEKETALLEYAESVRRLESKFGDIKVVHSEIEKRKLRERELEGVAVELRDSWKALYQWAIGTAPTALLGDALMNLEQEVNAARSERRLPPPVDPSLLKELLSRGSCVCGNSLEEGASGRQAIQQLLDEYAQVGRIGEEMLAVESDARNLLGALRSGSATASALMKRIGDWETRQQQVGEELGLLNARLAQHDDATVAKIQAELDHAKDARDREQREVIKLEQERETLRQRIKETEREMELIAAKDQKAQKLMLEARFAKRCLQAAVDLHATLCGEVRNTVSTTLEKHFLAMTWKRETVDTISINKDYKVSVRNRAGFEQLPVLSAGERECLALAFSLALSEVSGYELPMVIDTPMGRLSADVQENMAEVLAKVTARAKEEPAHQLIMLMTEVEYSPRVAKVLGTRDPRVFNIEFDEATMSSALREVS